MKPQSRSTLFFTLACLLGAVLFSSLSQAQISGYYIEGSAGAASSDYRFFRGFSNFESDGTLLGITVGVRFNDNFSIETGYIDYGDMEATLTANGLPNLKAEVSAHAWVVNVLGKIPISPRWNVFGKLGTGQFNVESYYLVTDSGANFDAEDKDLGLILGFGTQYRFNRRFGAKLEYQQTIYDSPLFSDELVIQAVTAGFKVYF